MNDAIASIDVTAEAKSQEPEAVLTNSALRQMWREAGGSFHGPHVETGTMPEEKLLPFLRSLAHPPAVSVDAIKAALRPFIGHDTLGVKAQDAARVVAALIAGGR